MKKDVFAVQLNEISKIYGSGHTALKALKNVSLAIPRGAYWAIMGPSGSGKSTLLHLLGLLDRPSEGSLTIGNQTISPDTNLSDLSKLRRESVGFIFQQFYLLPKLNALENIMLPAIYAQKPASVAQKRARDLLEQVGLSKRADHRPNQMSGGEQQRVAIARSLMNDPSIILADEPTGNLDSVTGASVLKLIRSLKDQGKTIVVVTHDEAIGEQAEKIIRLRDGSIV